MKYNMYCPDNLKEKKVVYESIIFQEFATHKNTLLYILYREPYILLLDLQVEKHNKPWINYRNTFIYESRKKKKKEDIYEQFVISDIFNMQRFYLKSQRRRGDLRCRF